MKGRNVAALAVAVGLALGSFAARADIVWDWTFAGEQGTFTTDGTLSGAAPDAGTYTLADFSVTASGAGAVLGSVSGGNYFEFLGAPYTMDWTGSALTGFAAGGGTAPWVFFDTNTGDSAYVLGYALDATPTSSFVATGAQSENPVATGGDLSLSTASVPEPATLGLMGLGFAGLGLLRRRRAR